MELVALLAASLLAVQDGPPAGWKLPPDEIVAIVDARPTPSPRVSPDGQWLLLTGRPAQPPLAAVAKPWLGLAGLRVDPATGGSKIDDLIDSLVLRKVQGDLERIVPISDGAGVSSVSWSPYGRWFFFTEVFADRIDLVVFDASTGSRCTAVRGIAPLLLAPQWTPWKGQLVCALVPDSRGAPPPAPAAPVGPSAQETDGEKSPTRTFQDLLRTPHDEAIFDHFATTQLALVDIEGKVTRIGAPDRFASVEACPRSGYLLVERLERPYSYLLTVGSFPRSVEVWNVDGDVLQTLAKIPLEENVPIEGVPIGPRSHRWHPSANEAQVIYVEALDGGDPKAKADFRDRVLSVEVRPGDSKPPIPRELFKLEHRFRGITFFSDPTKIAATDHDRDRRWIRTRLFEIGPRGTVSGKVAATLDDRSTNDRYRNPGSLLTDETVFGSRVVLQDGNFVYRTGEGESKDGARPFLDRYDLTTGKTERLWQCGEKVYESIVTVIDHGAGRKPSVLLSKEAQETTPNLFVAELESGVAKQVTSFTDPTPQIRGITKQLIRYPRKDGVELSATLYLPKGYDKARDGKLPLFVWAYPLEFSDAGTAGQVSGSPWRFTRIGGISHLLLLTQGYAILDNATMPIVGDPETMNDTFLEQIVASAQAAIDEAERLGVGDRERVAVGGHSYGAFMTANLLAHCDLFRAGIARSGAYNRTLTPFGFQSERRSLWEAKDSYAKLSPFFFADKIDEPLLLIHGTADSNSGTFPMQSERLFQAVKGHGGKARLVLLPNENHGYRGRESVLHCDAEMVEWLDRYVKHAKPRGDEAPGG